MVARSRELGLMPNAGTAARTSCNIVSKKFTLCLQKLGGTIALRDKHTSGYWWVGGGAKNREKDNWSSLSLSTPLLPIVVAPGGLELVPNWTKFWDKHFCPFN